MISGHSSDTLHPGMMLLTVPPLPAVEFKTPTKYHCYKSLLPLTMLLCLNLAAGTAAVPNAEEVPLSDEEGEEGAAGAATGPPEEPPSPSARQAEAGPSTAAGAAAGAEEAAGPSRGAAAAAAAAHDESDGRHSPPPMEPAEVAGLDVVNAEDDARMLQLLRQQVGVVVVWMQ